MKNVKQSQEAIDKKIVVILTTTVGTICFEDILSCSLEVENYRVPQCSNQYVVRRFSKSRRSVQQYMIVVNRRRNRHRESLQCCQCCAEKGSDKWGKTSFQGNPRIDLDIEIFYAAKRGRRRRESNGTGNEDRIEYL